MKHILALLMVGTMLALSVTGALAFGPTTEGPVTQKFLYFSGRDGGGNYLIAVDGTNYAVPFEFYAMVQVGNVVKFDGTHWTLIQ